MELYVIASLGFCAIAALMYFATKSARHRQAPAFSPGPKNNKEVVVQGWTESDLKRILAHFEKLYEGQLGPAYSVTLKKVAESIRLSFPYDIPAEKFGFLVNYIHYPEGFDLKGRTIAASGTTTLSEAFAVPEESLVGQKALFYVPSNDQAYDLVYVGVGEKTFEVSFASERWKPVSDPRLPAGVRN